MEALFNEASVEILEKCLNPYRWWEERGKLSSRRNEAVRGKVTKAKGVHRRLDATSTRLNGSVHLREIDQRVARSVASKSMGTAGTAFRTFDSWKTDGQGFSPPPSYRYGGIGGVGRVFRA